MEAYRVEMLRIPYCVDSRLTDGGKVMSHAQAALYSPETLFLCFLYSFLLEADKTPGPSAAGRILQIEKSASTEGKFI
jgi:hypothetical protein